MMKPSRLTILLDPEMHRQAKEKAEENGTTLSEIMRMLLRSWLNDDIVIAVRMADKDADLKQ